MGKNKTSVLRRRLTKAVLIAVHRGATKLRALPQACTAVGSMLTAGETNTTATMVANSSASTTLNFPGTGLNSCALSRHKSIDPPPCARPKPKGYCGGSLASCGSDPVPPLNSCSRLLRLVFISRVAVSNSTLACCSLPRRRSTCPFR